MLFRSFLRAYRTFLEGQLAEIRLEEERTARSRVEVRREEAGSADGDD